MDFKNIEQTAQAMIVGASNIKNMDVFNVKHGLTDQIIYNRKEMVDLIDPIMRYLLIGSIKHPIISGSRGCGKTSLITYMLNELKKFRDIDVLSINCRRFNTSYRIMKELTGAKNKTDNPGVIKQFENMVVNSKKEKNILVLDEVDALKDDKLLYYITRFEKFANLLVIMLTNKFSFYDSLTLDVKSSLDHKFFFLDVYDKEEVKEILIKRAKVGLKKYDEYIINSIAAITSQAYNSDTRIAIKSCLEIFLEKDYEKYLNNSNLIAAVMKTQFIKMKNEAISNLHDNKLLLLYLTIKYKHSPSIYNQLVGLGHKIVKSYFFVWMGDLERQDLIIRRRSNNKSYEYIPHMDEENQEKVFKLVQQRLPGIV